MSASSSDEEEFNLNREQVEVLEEADCNEDEETFKILLSTDNHLGFCEKNPLRGNDSFDTFEEILQIAVREDVDFILLGGDLFHVNHPSLNSRNKCLQLLAKYTRGTKFTKFAIVSDQKENFNKLEEGIVNYENPGYNISYPVFTIHGNHDDPIGRASKSAIDLLSEAGVVNYFGFWHSLEYIEINPILMRKGSTKLAIYGISHIHDRRFSRLLRDRKVEFLRPENHDDMFNILVLHQNRAARGPMNFIPVACIPAFIDLIVWGHEHDCFIDPTNVGCGYLTQPGSSVATSLTAGEAIEKKVGVLYVRGSKGFRLDPVPLKTVRPMIYAEMTLSDPEILGGETFELSKLAEKIAVDRIGELLADHVRDHPNADKLPLLRLCVHYLHDGQFFNPRIVSGRFSGLIANPENAVLLKRAKRSRDKRVVITVDDDDIENYARSESVLECINKQLEKSEDLQDLNVLFTKNLGAALTQFVEKGDSCIYGDYVDVESSRAWNYYNEEDYLNLTNIELSEKISLFNRYLGEEAKTALFESIINNESRIKEPTTQSYNDNEDSNDDTSPTPKPRGRGRGTSGTRGQTSQRTSRARGGRRGRASISSDHSNGDPIDIDADLDDTPKVTTTKRGTRSRGRRARGSRS